MSHNNKGSILITTLMIFSIICTICMGCIALVYTNNNYFKLEYNYIQMKEKALSGIEITRSSILQQVNYAIENCNNEKEFTEYFLGNIKNIIGDVSNSGLENVSVSIDSRPIKDEDQSINLKIISSCRDEIYKKRISANIKIKNPWIEYVDNKVDESAKEYSKEHLEENIEENIDTTENDKNNFNEKDLVVIYNYKEI